MVPGQSTESAPSAAEIHSFARQAIVLYQPIVDLTTGQIIGAEALARFPNPDGTVRTPGGIIEYIERSDADLEAFTGPSSNPSPVAACGAMDGGPCLCQSTYLSFFLGLFILLVWLGGGHWNRTTGTARLAERWQYVLPLAM